MKIGIVGLGLIGASLGEAILKYTDHEVLGYDIDPDVLKRASDLCAHTSALKEEDYKSLDLVIFALNPDVAIGEMRRICPLLKDGATIADTCGNKRVIINEMEALKAQYPSLRFIGTHPMAGKEFSGIEYASAQLFCGAYMILVPVGGDTGAAERLKELSLKIGFKDAVICSADKHDEMIAYTSQLAHVVSSCYVQNPLSKEHTGFSAGSFADLTRVARLNPDMWTELFLQNRDNLSVCIEDMIAKLKDMLAALSAGDADRLRGYLEHGTRCKEIADSASEGSHK